MSVWSFKGNPCILFPDNLLFRKTGTFGDKILLEESLRPAIKLKFKEYRQSHYKFGSDIVEKKMSN